MEEQNRKHHNLSRSSQLTLWGIFALCVLFPFSLLGSKGDGFIFTLFCYVPFGLLALSLIPFSRIASSSAGLGWGRKIVPWNVLERIAISHVGTVNLLYREQTRIQERVISVYVDDWRTNELILAIHQFAPQVQFPPDLFNRPAVRWFQATNVILILLLMQFMIGLVLTNLLHQALIVSGAISATQRTPLLMQAIQFGFIGGVASGMGSLGVYNFWRNRQPNNKKLVWSAVLCYLQPWSGAILGLIVGILLFLALGTTLPTTRTTETWFRSAGFLVSGVQLYFYPLLVSKINQEVSKTS